MIPVRKHNYTMESLDIFLVGLGGTGSQLLPMLTQLLANYNIDNGRFNKITLTLIDGDEYEEKNKANQKCITDFVNRNKAEVMYEIYSTLYQNLNIAYYNQYIRDVDTLKTLITNRIERSTRSLVIVISAVDNNATRKIFHEIFYDEDIYRIIYIDAGNGDVKRVGQVVTGYKDYKIVQDLANTDYYISKYVSEVILKPVGDIFTDILQDNDDIDRILSCEVRHSEQPQHISSNVLSATTIFMILTNIIMEGIITSHITYFDAEKIQVISRQSIQ